jgi:hypothetical protein
MSTHPAITPTCADHRRRWHDLGERGWADHAALEYPHGHRVALGEGGMRRSEVANLPHAMRAAGQDDACRRLLARGPVGHGQLYQAARCRLCWVERRGYPLLLAEVLPLARSAITRQHRSGRRPDRGLVRWRSKEAYRCVMTR